MQESLAAADVALTLGELEQIAALDRSFRYVDGTLWTPPGSPYTLQSLWDGP